MKASLVDQALIFSTPFTEQTVTARSRYHWDSRYRGEASFVILQKTLAGEGTFENAQGRRIPVPVDHAFVAVVPENSKYYYPPQGREPWTFTWLNFSGLLACTLFRAFQDEFGPVVFLSPHGAAAAALRRVDSYAARSDRTDHRQLSLHAYEFILEWWREAAEPNKGSGQGLEWAIRFCREHFRESLGVKQIAAEAGLSREHFSRMFSAKMKVTPAAFLRTLRLHEAEALLRQTRLPLREVALQSGFYSDRHLMRAFQREYGKSPSAWRQRLHSRQVKLIR